MLLRGQHREHRGELSNFYDWFVGSKSTGNSDIQIFRCQQFRRHVAQLIEGYLLLLDRDSLENRVVNVPGLVDIRLPLRPHKHLHPAKRFKQVRCIALVERDLIHGVRFPLHLGVDRRQEVVHGFAIEPVKVNARGFFNGLEPHFGEHDCRPVHLGRDGGCLVDQRFLGGLQLFQELLGSPFAIITRRVLLD